MKTKMAMSSIKIMFFLSIALFSQELFSQQVVFKNVIDFDEVDAAMCLKQTSDSGYIFCGASAPFSGNGACKPSRVKTDKNGIMQWQYTYNTPYYINIGRWIEQTPDGGYIMVADSCGTSSWDIKTLLLKIDASGQVQWTRHYGNYNEPHNGNCIKKTFDGGYIVCGNVLGGGPGRNQFLLKTDSNGVMQWYNIYYKDYLYQVFQTNDSGYVAFGYTRSMSPGGNDMDVILLKTDKNGTQQWVKTYGTAQNLPYIYGHDCGYAFDTIPGGGYICICTFDTCGFALLRTDANGNILWVKKQDVVNNFTCINYCINRCSDGGYLYTENKKSNLQIPGDTSFTSNLVVVKTNSIGDTLWTKEFGFQLDSNFSNNGHTNKCIQTNDGGYAILTQVSCNIFTNFSDYYLIKLDSSGILTSIYPVIYSQQENVIAYPNPTNDVVNIDFPAYSAKENTVLEIQNIDGRLLKSQQIMGRITEVNLNDMSSGIYFIKVRNNNGVAVRKVIKE